MKSEKSRQKIREPAPDPLSVNFNVIFQIVSLSDAKILLRSANNATQLRDSLHAFLTNPQINHLYRPAKLGAWAVDGSKPDEFVKQTRAENESINNDHEADAPSRQKSIHMPNECLPETDLWYAALLDYLMEVIYWAVNDWIPGCKADYPEDPDRNCLLVDESLLDKTFNDEEALGISIALSTILALVVHIQLWDKFQQQNPTQTQSDNQMTTFKSSSLVATIHLMKQLFQTARNPKQPSSCETADLEQFERYHCGMLGVLNVRASIRIIRFLTDHFLHLYRLIERNFGLSDDSHQRLIEIPCYLEVNTLPKRFGPTKSIWPPPLCEALPLSLVAKYEQLFDKHVTRWLACLPPAHQPVIAEAPPEPETPTTSSPDAAEEPDLPVFPLDKYLLILEDLEQDQLEAIASTSTDQTDDVVRLILSEVQNEQQNVQQSESTMNQLKQTQIDLVRKLVDRATEKLIEIRKTSDKRTTVK